MKVSELIKELQKLKREHGDLDVYGGNVDQGAAWKLESAIYINDMFDGKYIHTISHLGHYCRECGRGCD